MKRAMLAFAGMLIIVFGSAMIGLWAVPLGEYFKPWMNTNQDLAGPIAGCIVAAILSSVGTQALTRYVGNPYFPTDAELLEDEK